MTLLDFEIILPPSTWTSDRVLSIVDEANAPIPTGMGLQTSNTLYDSLRVQLVANVAAETVSLGAGPIEKAQLKPQHSRQHPR